MSSRRVGERRRDRWLAWLVNLVFPVNKTGNSVSRG